MRGSGSTAIRSARAVALKIASAMWWLLRPWCRRTCRLHSALAAKACQKSSTSSLSKSPIFGAGNGGVEDEVVAAAQIDRRRHERLFHRQREVAVAANAGFVAEGLLHRLAKADADVFDRVMLIDVQVALGFDCQIDRRVLGEQRQHVIEEADAGLPSIPRRCRRDSAPGGFGFRGLAVDGCGAGHRARDLQISD